MPYRTNPQTGQPEWFNEYDTFMGFNPTPGAKKSNYNWLTDPNAPWNQMVNEEYLKKRYEAGRTSLLEDLRRQEEEASRNAIGQGLYTGTYTTSLPAESLARRIADLNRGYGGELAGLESNYLTDLMGQRERYGQMMLGATEADLARRAAANQGGFLGAMGDIVGMIPGIGGISGWLAKLMNAGNQGGQGGSQW